MGPLNSDMMSKAVVALALLESVNAFQAPVARARQVQMFSEGDIGVLPPLGVYDPPGLIASLESMPTVGWLQIMLTTCMMETGYFLFDYEGYPNVGDREAGDIGGEAWVRYDDPEVKTFKLNAERQNGRAAMLGITGCLFHELLGVDALYPTGGLGGARPRPSCKLPTNIGACVEWA